MRFYKKKAGQNFFGMLSYNSVTDSYIKVIVSFEQTLSGGMLL